MNEKEEAILQEFQLTMPQLTDQDKQILFAFGQGMMFKAEQQAKKEEEPEPDKPKAS